jgi:uncharacterized protein
MTTALTKEKILSTIAANRQQLMAYGVQKIGLFGSFVSNQATEVSDVDLLVDILRERKTFKNFMALNYYLEELLGRKVDLITMQSVSPYIGPHILQSTEYVSLSD